MSLVSRVGVLGESDTDPEILRMKFIRAFHTSAVGRAACGSQVKRVSFQHESENVFYATMGMGTIFASFFALLIFILSIQ